MSDIDQDAFSLEEDEDPDRLNGTESDKEAEQTQGEGKKNGKEAGRLRRLFDPLRGRKWVTGVVLTLFFMGLGLGLTQGYKWLPSSVKKLSPLTSDKSQKQDYYEEKLSPLFIPLQPDAPNQAVMIDFSVIWDGLASFRYKCMELQIRNRLYRYLVGFSEAGDNFKEKAAFIETEMSKIFRESLGMESLTVKVKEIREI